MKLTLKSRLSVSVLCLATFFCGCVSAGDVVYPSLYLKKTSNENDVYFASAPSMQTPQRELSECLFRVAKQISLRERVFVRYTETIGKKDNGFETKSITTYLDYDQNKSIALLDDLSVRETRRTEAGTEVLVKLGGKYNFKNASFSLKTWPDSRGNPGWVTSPPKGSHFFAVVGSDLHLSMQIRTLSAPSLFLWLSLLSPEIPECTKRFFMEPILPDAGIIQKKTYITVWQFYPGESKKPFQKRSIGWRENYIKSSREKRFSVFAVGLRNI
jgi:hypothetical protein